ncbi:recombination regulator RecX [Candidatus Gracilibacteria bacterium]|nr:recombination regulator RecX [Candidatus Gracilibacteria bacterium]MCF7856303.1 recombination regulator RecX [Candidatus Gracilibacteria bacterium]MCF7896658.1 recombination regulator RecX [Candidatus Gracilibacteria bacterium]
MKFFKKKPKVADERQVFNYACWLLARRNYSQKELLDKFEVKYIPNEEVFAKVFTKLIKFNLQSDEGFTEGFVRSHEHWGARRISLELKRRGIEEEMVEKFLPNGTDELTHCRDTLKKKLKGEKIPEEFKERQKISAFLARRGFDLDVIREVMGF